MLEQSALEDLLACEGWQVWVKHLKSQWGPSAYAARLEQTINQTTQDGAQLRALTFAHSQINALLEWPRERIKTLQKATEAEQEPASLSRRGTL